jgi:multidrug resistance efflux pump
MPTKQKTERIVNDVIKEPIINEAAHTGNQTHPVHKPKEKKTPFTYIKKHPMILDIIVFLIVISLIGLLIYWNIASARISIEKSQISAPIISLAPATPGILEKIYVQEGDHVSKSKIIAEVSGKPIYPQTNGIIISVTNTPGQVVSSQTPVAQMIDPKELRLIATIEENKGLDQIKVGQRVIFTADAFPKKQYKGYVDSITPTSRQSDIVFSISNARQENEFDIKIKYDVTQYPELKNGMSAKTWVYK